jgi:hypothetical protein
MTTLWSLLRRKTNMTADFSLNILTLCGSVRKESYNAALLRALPSLSSGDLIFKEGPSVADIPIYDGDLERLSGFPAVLARIQLFGTGRAEKSDRLGIPHAKSAVRAQAGAHSISIRRPDGRCADAASPQADHGLCERARHAAAGGHDRARDNQVR